MSVKGTRLTIGKASLAVGAGLLGLSLMSVMTADDGPPDAVLAEMQSTTKELAEKVGGAVAGAGAAVLDSARSSLGGVLELAPKKTRTGKHKKKIKSKSAVKKARKREAKAAASAAAVAAAAATPPKRKTPPAREEATAADAAALPAFAVGARVEAKWGWQWSRAVIDRVNDDGTYDVEWVDEPDVFNTVAAADVRAAVGDAPAPPPQAASAPEEETPPAAAAVGNEGEEHAESVRWLLDGAAPKVVAEMLLVNACFEIAFAQANPNRPESASYTRYEAYKKAKCGADVIALGGSKSDVLHNYKKGFLRVVKCPAMIGYDLDRDAVSSEREEEGEEDTPPEPKMLARRTARRAQKRELFVAESATVDNKRAKRVACE